MASNVGSAEMTTHNATPPASPEDVITKAGPIVAVLAVVVVGALMSAVLRYLGVACTAIFALLGVLGVVALGLAGLRWLGSNDRVIYGTRGSYKLTIVLVVSAVAPLGGLVAWLIFV